MSRDTFMIYALAFVMVAGSGCAGTDLPTETASPDLPSQDLASAPGGDPARSADAFVNSIGVNVHISYLDRVYGSGFATIIKPKLAKLGVRHLRDGGQVTSNNDWMKTIYGRMRDIASAGPKFTLIMAPQGGDYNKADHVARLVEYAGPAVEAFEGPNELDMRGGYWAPNLRAFQRALYTRVKGDPALRGYTVVGPSLGRAGRASEIGDLSASMDAASVHLYAGGDIPMATASYTLSASTAMNGARPVWITETGYHNATASSDPHAPVSERAAGRYVPRMFLDYFNAGSVRSYAYELIDQGADASKAELSFGLLRVDGTEKPAYRALTNLIALLSDPGAAPALSPLAYSLKGDTKDVRRLLLQKRDGTFYLLLWLDVPSYDLTRRTDINVATRSLTLQLPTAFSRVRLFDPLVSQVATGTFTATSTVTVPVSDAPVIVELKR